MKLRFEKVFCINLDRRPDRWSRFVESIPADWPFGNVNRVSAIDGKRCPAPGWWSVGNYAWACYKSHLNLIERCLNQGVESCLILEDDAVCCSNFSNRVARFAAELPSDWQMLYLGGQHLDSRQHPPLRLSEQVYIPYDINRCHAYALRGVDAFQWYYRHLCKTDDWQRGHHVDHHAGRAHRQRTHPIYCPADWFIGQDEGKSDICWKDLDVRFFPPARHYLPREQRLTVVLSSSWTQARSFNHHLSTAGFVLLEHLLKSNQPSVRNAANLMSALNQILSHPERPRSQWCGNLMGQFADAIRSCFIVGRKTRRPTALNHPALSLVAPILANMFPNQLNVISVSSSKKPSNGIHFQILERAKHQFTSAIRCPIFRIDLDQFDQSRDLKSILSIASQCN